MSDGQVIVQTRPADVERILVTDTTGVTFLTIERKTEGALVAIADVDGPMSAHLGSSALVRLGKALQQIAEVPHADR